MGRLENKSNHQEIREGGKKRKGPRCPSDLLLMNGNMLPDVCIKMKPRARLRQCSQRQINNVDWGGADLPEMTGRFR